MADNETIRIGILCAGTTVPYWQAQAVRHLLDLPNVQLVAVGTPHPDEHTRMSGSLGLRAQLEKRCLMLLAASAAKPVDLSDPLALVPGVELAAGQMALGAKDLWSTYAPDLLISFLPPTPYKVPSEGIYPVWEFRFGGGGIHANGVPAMQSRFTQDRTLLVKLIEQHGKRSVGAAFPLRSEDDIASMDPFLLGAAWLPAWLVSSGRKDSAEVIGSTSINDGQLIDNKESMMSMLRSWVDLETRRFGMRDVSGPTHGAWNVGILHQPITSLLDAESSTNVRWLPSPSEGNHRMEPFGYIAPDGQLNVLYRKKHRNNRNDEIARLRPKSDSVLKRSRSMLSTSAPLHYPFVVERPEGAFAVISYPHQARTELFRVAESNDRMDHVKILLDKALISPTLIFLKDLWWLMGTDTDAPGTVLLAYYSETMEGPYKPHAQNPLKVDPVGTRPAGTPFLSGTDLWRPALDTTDPNSVAVVLNRVDVLTPSAFHEVAGRRFAGFPGTVYGNGIRTISAMGDITLIDGLRGSSSEKAPSKERKGGKRKHHRK